MKSCHDDSATLLLSGVGIGEKCVRARVGSKDGPRLTGTVFVAAMTSPHDIPRLLTAAAIVTDQGDWLCHAAVIARELDLACVVGATNATHVLTVGQEVIVCGRTNQVLLPEAAQ